MKKSSRILVTGSRRWTDETAVADALSAAVDEAQSAGTSVVRFILGDCPDGADAIALAWCEKRLARDAYEVHSVRLGPNQIAPTTVNYHARNQRMVAAKPDRFIAFWDGGTPTADGTLDTMRRCVLAGISGQIIADQGASS